MSWREYQLRLKGFERQEKRSLEKLRVLAYQIFRSGMNQPKKPMTIEQFWPLEGDNKSELTKSNISALKKAQSKVFNENKWQI